jgi:protein ImuB
MACSRSRAAISALPGDDVVASVPLIDQLRVWARMRRRSWRRTQNQPERAWRGGEIKSKGQNRLDLSATSRSRSAQQKEVESDPAFPRPIWLLSEPEPLGHLLEAQPWVLRDGPERIESGWWDGADVRRDYFVAENPRGETVWIYRDHRYGIDDGEWFMLCIFA